MQCNRDSVVKSVKSLSLDAIYMRYPQIAKSNDELVTSRSITRQHDFPDFDMIDAMIASAWKKLLNTQSKFRKRVSVEEQ